MPISSRRAPRTGTAGGGVGGVGAASAAVLVATLVATLAAGACTASGDEQTDAVAARTPSAADQLERGLDRAEGLTFVDDLDIYVVRRGYVVQLTASRRDGEPTWSPGGRRLAFVSARHGPTSDVYVMNADGSRQRRVVATRGADEFGLAWSPSGRRIAFSIRDDNGYAVGVMRSDGSRRRVLWRPPSGAVSVADWSPDGRTLLLQRDPDSSGDADLYTLPATTDGTPTRLTTHPGLDSNGRYSPDGSRIAYHCAGHGAICEMRSDGSGQRPRVRLPSYLGSAQLDWSRDGRRIAWTGRSVLTQVPLRVTDVASRQHVILTGALDSPSAVAWQPARPS